MTRRALAAVAAVLLVVTGLLGLRHEATVAHVRDRATGELVHAHGLAELHHTSRLPHLHGRATEHDDEACPLDGALHHVTVDARAIVTQPVRAAIPSDAPITPITAIARLYRLAPKTSPPAIG